jgi:ribulose-5-phosphate 4-epimerase/fuculose-1-phosphate aldolase
MSIDAYPSIRERFRDRPTPISTRVMRPGGEPTGIENIRRHRQERLAAAFRVFARLGLDHGLAGHITARDPELPDHFWVNPLAVPFGRIKVSDLQLVNDRGEIVIGDRPVNTAAFAIHSEIHAARPDVVAAAHSHALAGKAFSTLGQLLDPITQDACVFYGRHALYEDFNGIVLDPREGAAIAAALGDHKALILRNHGFLTVGATVEEAAWLFITADASAHAQLLAQAAGTPLHIRPEIAAGIARGGTGGGFSFQSYWETIIAEQPDLFD